MSSSRRISPSSFQPTRPLRGATLRRSRRGQPRRPYFNPRAPCGARRQSIKPSLLLTLFQPTRPLRGATVITDLLSIYSLDFNPRAPCGARPSPADSPYVRRKISTHAPLAGRDDGSAPQRLITRQISTHAPLAGRDSLKATVTNSEHISTHAPLAGRDRDLEPYVASRFISTHAPLAGRDSKSVQITMHIFAITDKFQMLLHRMPPVRAFCSFLMQENHADFGCEPPK